MPLTEEQKKLRLGGIGGSEIAAVVGRSRWKTPMGVWLSKVDPTEQHEESRVLQRGRILEPSVLAWWEEDSGGKLVRSPGTVFHVKHPHVFATPDAIGERPGVGELVVEAKTARFLELSEWGAPYTDEVPTEYLFQTQFEMAVTELPYADLAVLVAGDELRIYRLFFDADLFGFLAEAAEKFWVDHVEKRVPPKVDGSEAAHAWLKRRYPRELSLDMLPATPEVDSLAISLWNKRRNLRVTQEEERALTHQLAALIGEARGFQGKDWKATWTKNRDTQKVDWQAVAETLWRYVQEQVGTSPLATPERLRAIWEETLADHSETRPGARVLRLNFPNREEM